MPEMDGIEATRRIHEQDERSAWSCSPASPTSRSACAACGPAPRASCPRTWSSSSLPRALRGSLDGEAAISRRLAMQLVQHYRSAPTGGMGLRPVRSNADRPRVGGPRPALRRRLDRRHRPPARALERDRPLAPEEPVPQARGPLARGGRRGRRAPARARRRAASRPRPASCASRAIWTRLPASSLASSRETCALTVATLMYSSAAMSAFDLPWPIAIATSRSRSVSRSSSSRARARRAASPSSATCSISRRVTVGDSIASPAATSRIARMISGGGVSFSRNPAAPARSARSTWSSASKVVSTITCGAPLARAQPLGGGEAVDARHADVHQHDVGRGRRRPRRRPRAPSDASATTRMSSVPASIIDRPARTSASSSTIRTRITAATAATPRAGSRRPACGRARAARRPGSRARRGRRSRCRCRGSRSPPRRRPAAGCGSRSSARCPPRPRR